VHGIEAFPANRKTGKICQRQVANAAIGGEQNGKKAFGSVKGKLARPGVNIYGSNRTPCHWGFGLDSPNSVSTTAEDCLRDARKKSNSSRGAACQQV